MKRIIIASVLMLMSVFAFGQKADTRLFEMRIYYPEAGKMADMQSRFRNHTLKLFEKHGMTNIGYFVPQRKPDSVLIYILAFKDRAQRDSSWKAFGADLNWKSVQSESEKNGKLIKKIDQYFLTTTDFSPNDLNKGSGVFELRTYKASPYNLGLLMARFRNHTVKIFEKHGMKNHIYWNQVGKDDMLIYLLSHANKEAAKVSFDAFRLNPDWLSAREASEKLAKGSITTSVVSEFLIPTDFSPWK